MALARAAGSASRGETEQLQRVLADQRRENQVLTEEIHQLNTKLASTAAARDRDSLQADKNGMAGAVQALQLQLAQLQTADTALKARQQQDQAVRSLSECEADLAVGRARQAELERDRLAAQLSREQELHRQQVMSVCFVPFRNLDIVGQKADRKAFVKHEAAEQEDVDQQDVVEQKADSKPYYEPSVRQHRILLVTVFLLGCLLLVFFEN